MRPVTVALVAGAATVFGVPAVAPAYGVTRYSVTGPPEAGAVHDTSAEVVPAATAPSRRSADRAIWSAYSTSTQ